MTEEYAKEMTKAEQFWYRVWGRHWLARTIFAKRFWNEPFKDYSQTWYYVPHWKPMKSFLQGLCWLICRHEKSDTEWGYGGGEYVDNWCRWCNKVIKVPISETRFRHPTFNEIRPDKWKGNNIAWDRDEDSHK